jgi:hypothetical protein
MNAKRRAMLAPYCAYSSTRYWLLCELRRVRATVRIGTQSLPNARKERKSLQRELVKLRGNRLSPK